MRRVVLLVHLLCSLLFWLFIVAITTTGSLLVMESEISRLLHPGSYKPTPGSVPLQDVVQKVRSALPEYKVDRIMLDNEDGLYELRLVKQADGKTSSRTVFADPGTGSVMGDVGGRNDIFAFLLRLHRYLLLQDTAFGKDGADIAAGTVGAAFIIILLTGAYLWWPGLRRWAAGFKVTASKGKHLLNLGLHKTIGIASLPLLLVIAVSGTALHLDKYVFQWLGVARTPAVPAAAIQSAPTGGAPLPLDRIVGMAQERYPDAKPIRITLPQKPEQAVQLGLKIGYSPNGGSNVTAYIDAYSGKLLWQTDSRSGIAVYNSWRSGLHFGRWGGIPVKMLYVLVGLMPLLLMVTGVTVWQLKARARRRRRRRLATQAAAA